jgi:cytochrome c oxidase assembly protein subunit 15
MATAITGNAGNTGRAERDTRPVEAWLWGLAAMVLAIAVIGAATRLTGSGLSITEWNVVMGVIPPLNEAQWLAAFEKYKQIPQYSRVNPGMTLAEFKTIFWWEWSHRLVARGLIVVFAAPLLWLWRAGRVPQWLYPRLAVLFGLGALQGLIGWLMVKSGLTDRVSVSPYRLALHLGCPILILALMVWSALELRDERRGSDIHLATVSRGAIAGAWGLASLVYLQILAGALVAGNKAGLTYNTWPLMDGRLVPNGMGLMSPWWRNLFENVTTVQFNHRMLAYAVVAMAVWQAVRLAASADDPRVRQSALWVAAGALAQAALGIWTLLAVVPIGLGIAHQAGAIVLVALAVWHLFAVRRARRG